MRGQKMNDAQKRTVERLVRKGWRGCERDMFRLAVPMYRDRPHLIGVPGVIRQACVVHIRRDGSVHNGYPTRRSPH